ncbi:alpha-ketoglutarate-dependent dioxygenase AlkB family protein [Aegicerativicinus sediminis]|uniref:alpha-ketoglutarate-dependent dioxygenase AlkB family protein n=1 Tax=Aegicerativicinus sediminis TaxID=2893202 RepID=UPI001E46450D|nr:alpha-ketoglutarate-dependent dioxygenase AlkB [Aegicerativicinus sediminis]
MTRIKLPDAEVYYYKNFLNIGSADYYFQILFRELNWKSLPIKIFGKEFMQPRLIALYGNEGLEYTYSGTTLKTERWSLELEEIKKKIEEKIDYKFNSVLANLYRNGNDSNGWHADNEKSLGKNPVIASISLGAARTFKMKHNLMPDAKLNITLEHGSLLVMEGQTQHFYKHQIPKTKKNVSERINLTFRTLFS